MAFFYEVIKRRRGRHWRRLDSRLNFNTPLVHYVSERRRHALDVSQIHTRAGCNFRREYAGIVDCVGLGISGPIRPGTPNPICKPGTGIQREFKGTVVDVKLCRHQRHALYFGGPQTLLGPFVESLRRPDRAAHSFVTNPFYRIITNPSSGPVQSHRPASHFETISSIHRPQRQRSPWRIHLSRSQPHREGLSNGLQVLGTYVFSQIHRRTHRWVRLHTWLAAPPASGPETGATWTLRVAVRHPDVFQFSYVYQFPFGRASGGASNSTPSLHRARRMADNGILAFDNGMPLALSVSNRGRCLLMVTAAQSSWPAHTNDGAMLAEPILRSATECRDSAPFTVGMLRENDPDGARSRYSHYGAVSFQAVLSGGDEEAHSWSSAAEAFNALNHPQFAGPTPWFGSSAFGRSRPRRMAPGSSVGFETVTSDRRRRPV